MRSDHDDGVRCHLCGGWFKRVGGSHLIAKHGITVVAYREMFHLNRNVSTEAPELTERKRRWMLDEFDTGDRDRLNANRPGPATVGRWRSLAFLQPALAAELHPTRNPDIDASELGCHSTRRVWWRCGDCGHGWQTTPHRRMRGNGCPACARAHSTKALAESVRARKASPSRPLSHVRPDLVAEWHPTRNGQLTPDTTAAGSELKVWWRCSTEGCGSEWQAVVGDRTRRDLGCPKCGFERGGQKRAAGRCGESLAALHPHLLPEWHPTRNGDLDPFALKPGSEQRVWWQCQYCSAEWQAPPQSRQKTQRGGCPTCATRMARGVDPERLSDLAGQSTPKSNPLHAGVRA